jgi:uncharacterized protein YndB with AHSA1/START domain/DNA-binding transcriptional ArsR family regulator
MCLNLHMSAAIALDLAWKALAAPERRRMLDLLAAGPRATGELLGAAPGRTRFAAMNHLALLRRAGLVRVERRGRERLNHLEGAALSAAKEELRRLERGWAVRLERLKRHVEQRAKEERMSGATATPVAFEIVQELRIAAPPPAVFAALTRDLAAWWGAPFLLTGEEAADLALDARPGGLMLETTRGGDGAVWGVVHQVRKDRLLELHGRMAMLKAVSAVVRFELAAAAGGATALTLVHRAVGLMGPEARGEFEAGWAELTARLRDFAERGERRGLKKGA